MNSNSSICEKSMKLMTNIVKVSYISIAKFGFTTGRPHQQTLAGATPNAAATSVRYRRNLRSHEPAAVSYLVHPGDDTNKSSKSVDSEAWDYIKKVRAKNMKDANEITNLNEVILPPPPPRIMLQSSAAAVY